MVTSVYSLDYGSNVDGTKMYDTVHGGPYDRGSADSYYHRPRKPHYWPEGTLKGTEVTEDLMTNEEIEAYNAGYDYNEAIGDKKDWG